ncbi:MAG: N-acetyltransferase family protein [Bacteroidota bacterium]
MNIIRDASMDDAQRILDIYAPFILNSRTSFESEVPSLADFQQRMADTQKTHPWLVYEADRHIAGYAYAGLHRKRHAYQWSTEVSVYLHDNFRGKGLAVALYDSLFACLTLQGFYTAFAGITMPNDPSERFHKKYGFEEIGRYKNVGYKMGVWADTLWLSKPLVEDYGTPSDIIAPSSLQGTKEWESALSVGL